MNDQSKVDLHCHSSASAVAKLGVQHALALPECATAPREVYELAKRRGMDFVTMTDHDTIDGVLELADEDDVFVSEELTAWFMGEPQAVHVLCFGITPDDHEWLQAHRGDVAACADYLHTRELACALAHPFFHVAAPLTPHHRRILAELFPVWETRNGTRPRELNAPAAIYTESHGGIAIGGSDDHAGVDTGRTFTQGPPAASPAEFLCHLRAGRVSPGGQQGSPAKWAHSALVLAARALAGTGSGHLPPDPRTVFKLAQRVILDAEARHGTSGDGGGAGDLGPEDGRRVLGAWLEEMDLETELAGLLEALQSEDFSHQALERRARRVHERKLTAATAELLGPCASADLGRAATRLFGACLPAIPYIPAAAFMARERAKLVVKECDPVRVAVVADGVGSVHGVTRVLSQLRERGIGGHQIDVIGTDASVDRRLGAVAEIELPYYPGLEVGVPSLLGMLDALTEQPYDLVHVCAPGPAGIAAAAIARIIGLPLVGSYHTELQAYARSRSADAHVEQVVGAIVATFYGQCDVVLTPSRAAGDSLFRLGIAAERVRRWERGVDTARFNPGRRQANLLPDEFNVLYVGRLSREKGIDLLAEGFLAAREQNPHLHLVLAGRGPEEEPLRRQLGSTATFLGWLEGNDLANAYASADLFAFASTTDTFGQVILEAQASALPVLAVDAGGPGELIEHGRSGCLVPPDSGALSGALRSMARRQALRDRLARGGLRSVRERTWERSLEQLSAGYAEALGPRRLRAALAA